LFTSPSRPASWTACDPVAYLQGLRLDVLRCLAVVSLPLSYQASNRKLPGTLFWFVGLVVATLATLAVVYAALECRWSRRARRGATSVSLSNRVNLSFGVIRYDDLRPGLRSAWGVLALAPAAAALGADIPPDLISALSPVALGLVAARIVLEARRRPSFAPGAPRHQRAWAGRFGVR